MNLAIAPMLDWTDRHYRYFMRKITQYTELYTEMIVADAIIHGNSDKLLSYSSIEKPLVVQLGGSDPKKLALASKKCAQYNYSKINLNIGCPSARVKSGNFGACLMLQPELVVSCIKAMQDAVDMPITIKHRIGINYDYDYKKLATFIQYIAKSGCSEFIIHARNAVLTGLSPKENREIPPLKYDYVYQLKKDFPELTIIINGGIKQLANLHNQVDGIMIGRQAYYDPFMFVLADKLFYNCQTTTKTRKQIAISMIEYLIDAVNNNIRLHAITRHMLGLYYNCSQAKIWRQTLTTEIIKTNSIDTYINLVDGMHI